MLNDSKKVEASKSMETRKDANHLHDVQSVLKNLLILV